MIDSQTTVWETVWHVPPRKGSRGWLRFCLGYFWGTGREIRDSHSMLTNLLPRSPCLWCACQSSGVLALDLLTTFLCGFTTNGAPKKKRGSTLQLSTSLCKAFHRQTCLMVSGKSSAQGRAFTLQDLQSVLLFLPPPSHPVSVINPDCLSSTFMHFNG